MTAPYAAIRSAMRSQVWAIQPEKLEQISAFLQLKYSGGAAHPELLAAIQADSAAVQVRAQNAAAAGGGTVAVLPIYGMILYRGSAMGDISGPSATSVQKLTQQFRQALNDPNVKAIVFDVDSPGGTVEGVDELASEIRAAKGKKPTIAVSNCLNASAAYYLSSACSEVVVAPSSLTGSVGVYCAHEDDSEYLEKMGVKISLIQFGENKTNGNSYEPLSDAARADMQEMVDQFGGMFERAVAKGRKLSQAKVHEAFGQGKCFTAQQAVKIGMADTVGTLDDVLARYGIGATGSQPRSQMDSTAPAIAATAPASADAGCKCSCDECTAGNCPACSNPDCDDANCGCEASTSARGKRAHAARQRALAIAAA